MSISSQKLKIRRGEWRLTTVPLLLLLLLLASNFGKLFVARQLLLPLTVIKPGGELRAVALSPDGTMVAVGGGDLKTFKGEVQVFDARTGALLYTVHRQNTWNIAGVAFSPDGKLLASGAQEVQLSDAATGQPVRTLTPRTYTASIVFSPDGKTLVAQHEHGVVLWDAQTGRLMRHLVIKMDSNSPLALAPDGKTLACISPTRWQHKDRNSVGTKSGGKVQLWDVATGALRRTFPYELTTALSFSPDGRQIVSAEEIHLPRSNERASGRIRMFDVSTGAVLWMVQGEFHKDRPDWDFLTNDIAFSPDGRMIACQSWNKVFLRAWRQAGYDAN